MCKSLKLMALWPILSLSWVGVCLAEPCPLGDLDSDCTVTYADLSILCQAWLTNPVCAGPLCPDLDYSDSVDIRDFAYLAQNWLKKGSPLVINEFLASNGAAPGDPQGLFDEDGDSSDWIEIYNPSYATIDMTGWYLTDNAGNLTKWQFPAVSLQPAGFMVVFASGKNRRNPAGQLHTNFKIDKDGEYLALVAADGVTIADEFRPVFPQQFQDISYGRAQFQTTLVASGATAAYHVPTAGDAGANWTSPGFNDSLWNQGPAPLQMGVDLDSNLQAHFAFDDGAGTIAADSSGYNKHGTLTNMIATSSWVAGKVGTGALDFDGVDDYVAVPALNITSVSVTITAWIKCNGDQQDWAGVVFRQEGGTWFGINIGPSNELRYHWNATNWPWPSGLVVGDNEWTFVALVVEPSKATMYRKSAGTFNTSVHTASHTIEDWAGVLTIGKQGFYPGRLFNGAIDDVHIYARALSEAEVNDLSVSLGSGTNVKAAMQHVNSALWSRFEFNVADIEGFDTLALRVKYRDGFVAYLNGHEIARRNAPATVQWNSAATATRTWQQAGQFEEINVTQGLGFLQTGNNVLAICGLNNNKDDEDFVILPELVAVENQNLWQYFTTVTPGRINDGTTTELLENVEFSHERGFYNSPFQLALMCDTSGAEIHYTTNGDDPRLSGYSVYTGPITINQIGMVRAVAFKPGSVAGGVVTNTYIFVDDVIVQSPDGQAPTNGNWPAPGASVNGQVFDYGMDPEVVNLYPADVKTALLAIPSVSIVTDLKNLVDPSTGIYVNSWGEGRNWERPTSIELINPNGSKGFQIDAGIRIRGAYGRSPSNPKHNFRLFFRTEYGNAKLSFPLFADEGVDKFDVIDLRAEQTWSWSSYGNSRCTFLRDVFARDAQRATGEPYPRSRYVHLYINGQYWGLYMLLERPQASFGASYFGGDTSDYDALKPEWTGTGGDGTITAKDGNNAAWKRLWNDANAGFATDDAYYRSQGMNVDGTPNPAYERLIDIDNVIDYMITIYYSGDNDAPITAYQSNRKCNNYFTLYNRVNPDGFKYFRNDAECSLGLGEVDRTGPYPAGSEDNWPDRAGWQDFNPQWLHQQLCTNAEYRLHFADHVHRYYFNNGAQTVTAAAAMLNTRASQINMPIIAESARWGDAKVTIPFKKSDWLNELNWILYSYFPTRTQVSLDQFKAKGWYPSVVAPTFNQHGGDVAAGFNLTMTAPAGTIYYTTDGNDPRLRGGAVRPGASTYSGAVSITISRNVKSRVKSGSTWSALNEATFAVGAAVESLRITELMYHPAGDPNAEYIELENIGPAAINLNLVKFTNGIDFTFGPLQLTAGQFVVVVRNRTAFLAAHPTFSGVIAGQYNGSLDNAGERICLVDAIGRLIQDFKYSDGWRDITDGDGFSLTIIDPAGDTSNWGLQDGWRPSAYVGGSPGSDDAGIVPNPGALVINEVLAHSHDDASDWIELYNTTAAPINIGGWFLSDSETNLTKYTIASGTTVPANGYIVFYQNTQFGNASDPGCTESFALSENGEIVCLSSGQAEQLTGYRQKEDFGASPRDVAFGRYYKASTDTFNFVAMSSNTPGAANAYPMVGPIVINEIMYNPSSGNQDEEYVELLNISAAAVILADANGWKFTDAIDYTFPTGTTIGPGQFLVVAKNLSAFAARYWSVGSPVLGPYDGQLSNAGEQLELSMPGEVDELGILCYIRIDRVVYSDGTHPDNCPGGVDTWPTEPDGQGKALKRKVSTDYGNDVANWQAATPAPGI